MFKKILNKIEDLNQVDNRKKTYFENLSDSSNLYYPKDINTEKLDELLGTYSNYGIDGEFDEFLSSNDLDKRDKDLVTLLDPDEIEEYSREDATEDLLRGLYDYLNVFEKKSKNFIYKDKKYTAKILKSSDLENFDLDYMNENDVDMKTFYKLMNFIETPFAIYDENGKEIFKSFLYRSTDIFPNSKTRKRILKALFFQSETLHSLDRNTIILRRYLAKVETGVKNIVINNIENKKKLSKEDISIIQKAFESLNYNAKIIIPSKFIDKKQQLSLIKEENRSMPLIPIVEDDDFNVSKHYVLLDNFSKEKLKENKSNQQLRKLKVDDILSMFLMEGIAYKETAGILFNFVDNFKISDKDEEEEFFSEYIEQIQYFYKYILQKTKRNLPEMSFVHLNNNNIPNAYLMSYLQEEDDTNKEEIFFHDIAVIDRKKGIGTDLLLQFFETIKRDPYLSTLNIRSEMRGGTMYQAFKKLKNTKKSTLEILSKAPGRKGKKYSKLLRLKEFVENYNLEYPEIEEAEKKGEVEDIHYEFILKVK